MTRWTSRSRMIWEAAATWSRITDHPKPTLNDNNNRPGCRGLFLIPYHPTPYPTYVLHPLCNNNHHSVIIKYNNIHHPELLMLLPHLQAIKFPSIPGLHLIPFPMCCVQALIPQFFVSNKTPTPPKKALIPHPRNHRSRAVVPR